MKIGVLGTGAYGLALTKALRRNHHELTMWTKFEEEKRLLLEKRGNDQLLPGITLEDDIKVTCDMKEACSEKELIILVIPLAFFESTIKIAKEYIEKDTVLAIATKGIEQNDGLFAHELLARHINTSKVAVISGPTFAIDLARDTVCALTVASKDRYAQEKVASALASNHLIIESLTDRIGVELCGGIKNVMAIATGMIEGLGQSESTKALFEKQALVEMMELIKKLGGEQSTIMSYAGVGDFLLTCNSPKSRNYTYGVKVGRESADLEEYEQNTTIEGLYTLNSLYELLKRQQISSPLVEKIYNICIKGENPENLLTILVEKR